MNPNNDPVVDSEQSGRNAKVPAKRRPLPKMLRGWRRQTVSQNAPVESSGSSVDDEKDIPPTEKWSLGILNDKRTEEVPGMSSATTHDTVI